MALPKRPTRLILAAILGLCAAALLWAVFGALRSGLALWQELRAESGLVQGAIALLATLSLGALAWIGWRVLRRPRRKPLAAPTREDVDARVEKLEQARFDTAQLQRELVELDRRARSEELYVAVFGEISAGKSALIRALLPQAQAQSDVLGGTTRAVMHYRGEGDGAAALTLADVPGTHESNTAGGSGREGIARDEALRAHVVLYVCAGDLTRDQDTELRWLHGFGKPVVLVLNKADQLRDGERELIERTLHTRYAAATDAQVAVSAGGMESLQRDLPDGRREFVTRERRPEIEPLRKLLARYAKFGAERLEPARAAAVLTSVAQQADTLETQAREREAQAVVQKYARRAVVGALAAVLPGSDLVIQGVLATALIRELAKVYDVALRDVDIDAFLAQMKLTLRTSASLVLAIAGNALKAFPGLGTLGGGVLHAIAYGLIFDSLGHAVAATLRDQRRLDGAAAATALSQLLADAGIERLRRIAGYALDRHTNDD
jgi:GTP-binding protein EngB required for normal cell division